MDERIKFIVNTYDYKHQCRKTMEELAELSVAISHFIDDDTTEPYNHLLEEFADVVIMLNQIQYMFDIQDHEIKTWTEYKLNRQVKRIKEGE